MGIVPVGTSTVNLTVFGLLWDAALLRRYGRAANLHRALHRALLRHPVGDRFTCTMYCRHLLKQRPQPNAAFVKEHRPPLVRVAPRALDDSLPRLDLQWPSDNPLDKPDVVVVERFIHLPPLATGGFLDLLY